MYFNVSVFHSKHIKNDTTYSIDHDALNAYTTKLKYL